MIGNVQKETLGRFANPGEDSFVEVRIHRWRRFTREAGGGNGYLISVSNWYTDVNPPEKDLQRVISLCRHKYTAFDKAKEIARFLVDGLGVPKSSVRIKSEVGKEER